MDVPYITTGSNSLFKDPNVLASLPEELLEILRRGNSPQYLEGVATAALLPSLTIPIYSHCEPIFADICARWISQSKAVSHFLTTFPAFARILPFAPHLRVFLEKYLQSPTASQKTSISPDLYVEYISNESEEDLFRLSDVDLQRILLAAYRLLKFDKRYFKKTISAARIQLLFQHSSRPVRYLAVKIICQLLSASDAKLEEMTKVYVGKAAAVMGDFDGTTIDYGFLSLYERKQLKEMTEIQRNLSKTRRSSWRAAPESLSPLVTCFSHVLLPRPQGPPSRPSSLVNTITTSANRRKFAQALLSNSPILIHGLSGAGKTCLVNDFAREVGKDSSMITLHLNEQTDAKVLIGMYATDSTPGSFTWRPGVLTIAVREGRWVFIEDLDRAPNDVISVLLPLIERGELLIPSRGDKIQATSGFRLVASIRTSLNVTGFENAPSMNMLGARLWNRVPIEMATNEEFVEIINGTFPILQKFLPGIIAVYERLYSLSKNSTFASKSRTSLGRPISPRELLKWCRRLVSILIAAGSTNGTEPITEATKDEMFMEAVDCFASSLQTSEARKSVIDDIGEEMNIPQQRVDHFFTSYVPSFENGQTKLSIGRATLSKLATNGRISNRSNKPRPFANTAHAKRLLEQVGVAVKMAEPVLLVGETGIGKTAVIQRLADTLGYKLSTVNLSQQSEVSDLLGGFKPVNIRSLAIPLHEQFEELFYATRISAHYNKTYLDSLAKNIAKNQWVKVSKLWREAPRMFQKMITDLETLYEAKAGDNGEQPTKRRRKESKFQALLKLKPQWDNFSTSLDQFDVQLSGGSRGLAFSFVEGNIVKAVRSGGWVLLDEINLASPDTLESIADLLTTKSEMIPSILLSDTGKVERIQAHPDFRIFAAMNPATDVGKRDLPMGLRSRFTEIYVESPDQDLGDLLQVINVYLRNSSTNDERAAQDVARLYLSTKKLSSEKKLVDGANQVPHFSLRTLTRVLDYAKDIAPFYGLRRALYEGFAMGFLTLLDNESERILLPLIDKYLLETHSNSRALLSQIPHHPNDGRKYIAFRNQRQNRQYWMLQGREVPQEQPQYIITPFVERNMLNLVRATSTRRFPVLVQGPTSSGKTSMIEYLANHSGNKFVRINNHEHTDLQEYLGTYVSGPNGELKFQEGLLVQALREGYWIVLDELNLAPTDVLEALNRLLDDNRELLIPETQEVVRPHENFMLFATQNPPGLYGGRKTLSRAFRNRFLELHFDDIPEDELQTILEKRSQNVAPSDCRRIVEVYKELSRLRQSGRLFEQKDSFATLRDLFRWALRDADNREQLAANGYMLLGERVRKSEERSLVKGIIEKVFKVKLEPRTLYDAAQSHEVRMFDSTENRQGTVWTHSMRRLYVLVAHALRNNEPVLLVGETGCGKTTVCQMLADAFATQLHIVNAHQNTETGDIIGAQRPVRNRSAILETLHTDLKSALNISGEDSPELEHLITAFDQLPDMSRASISDSLQNRIQKNRTKAKSLFEWSDGSLVQAMRCGQFFLLDEISLADDSVLERLNSVLEPRRSILLAEKGVEDSFVEATKGFQFFATMNPGGDYGKRELSPALRNRFTEIWVPSLSERDDVLSIVQAKLNSKAKHFALAIVDFAEWFGCEYRSSFTQTISVRDVLAWIAFINQMDSSDVLLAVVHGAAMVYIDTLGANPAALLAVNIKTLGEERCKCLQHLSLLLQQDIFAVYNTPVSVVYGNHQLRFGNFSIESTIDMNSKSEFAFHAPTTTLNAMRVVRALQVQKPILIEGSPGVGKTTLVAALATAAGKQLTRINLSEQTDLMDLFGSDVPVEGAEAGNFAWRDAPFLQAMHRGDWVLLDEMNLASQAVLEGLNACLDHRGEVYISELDQTFKRHEDFCVFAAQNPHHQGGGRKGLPSSFVNRFTVVYADMFQTNDLALICKNSFPDVQDEVLDNLIEFVSLLEDEVVFKGSFGVQGGPWEFNLRDILRWIQFLSSDELFLKISKPSDFLGIIFRQRFRTSKDREKVDNLFTAVFGHQLPFRHLFHKISDHAFQVGMGYLPRNLLAQPSSFPDVEIVPRLSELESVMMCVQQNLPCILVGSSGQGKTTLIEHVAAASGVDVVVFALNAEIDTMDLVGGFEQADPQRTICHFLKQLEDFLEARTLEFLPRQLRHEVFEAIDLCQRSSEDLISTLSRLKGFLQKLSESSPSPELETFLHSCQSILEESKHIESARFEWVDGELIKAVENGQWLVLDNANLCSSSVLDRLNSLLEPNGFLSINEHCGPDGQPKIVKPHPSFRLFLTMDPRFGELSRAMRNRSIEIYLDHVTIGDRSEKLSSTPIEASLESYGFVIDYIQRLQSSSQEDMSIIVAFENLSCADVLMMPRFCKAVQNGLVEAPAPIVLELCRRYESTVQPGNDGIATVISTISTVYSSLAQGISQPGLREHFQDAQPIHPLQNSPLVHVIQQWVDPKLPLWLGAALEFQLALAEYRAACQMQIESLQRLKPSQMSRLQRSLLRTRVSTVANDSTVFVADFLSGSLDAFSTYLGENVNKAPSTTDIKSLKEILRFWRDVYKLVSVSDFEDARFQALLSIGGDLNKSINQTSLPGAGVGNLAQTLQYQLETAFRTGFKLSTGLSMEKLWLQFRPTLIANKGILDVLLDMEQLAERFDSLRWKVSISIPDLAKISDSLSQAYRSLFSTNVDGKPLVQTITTELVSLGAGISKMDDNISPYFSTQFEALRRYWIWETTEEEQAEVALLSGFSTKSLMSRASATNTSRVFQMLESTWGNVEDLVPLRNTFPASLLHKLNHLDDVNLNSLRLLEAELPILGRHLAQESEIVSQNQVLKLNGVLLDLIRHTIDAHEIPALSENHRRTVERIRTLGGKLESEVTNDGMVTSNTLKFLPHDASVPVNLSYILDKYMNPAVLAIAAAETTPDGQLKWSSLAWINYALGSMSLYIPDRSFDPDLRQRVERQRHEDHARFLQCKLNALQQFESLFTGQNSSLRCQLANQEIQDLGPPKKTLQPIYRPEDSELTQLSVEFKNVLSVIDEANPRELVATFEAGNDETFRTIALLQENIDEMIRRLSDKFHGYRDMTEPACNMLRCLQVGLYLARTAAAIETTDSSHILSLSKTTPFLGGSLNDRLQEDQYQPIEFLARLDAVISVEGISSFGFEQRTMIFKVFHSFYEHWSKRLEADRKEAEAKSGLYVFKGSAEDGEEVDQEQFDELFPSFDGNDKPVSADTTKLSAQRARDLAIKLARLHGGIFLGSSPPQENIIQLLKSTSTHMGNMYDDTLTFKNSTITGALLPGSLLILHDKLESLQSPSSLPELYNFYTDANLLEARKLVILVHAVQKRFTELQNVDEIGHMQPLEDVLSSCRDLLEFRHTEALAKIITKVEKIHGFMHEWQFGGWATKTNSAPTLYDDLTATIVSWRRLELTTWGRLFDMENKACEEDAKSWWFIAYEVVIAAPLARSESEDELRIYAKTLLHELETYAATAIQGQFVPRLRILQQLQQHVKFLSIDMPAMSIVSSAVANFIDFYARHETTVVENIRKGRQVLEKAMRDVLLMASWKDTNIVALRDSAKRSHHKLFKLVRKYRALLAQPMQQILQAGLPNEEEATTTNLTSNELPKFAVVDKAALEVCQEIVPKWSLKSKRFVDVDQTVQRMSETTIYPSSAVDSCHYIESFLSSLLTSTAELQKATPSVLTEENKPLVKHLKSRKRKLFASILKDLRIMGIQHNLGTIILSSQASLPLIFSNVEHVEDGPHKSGADVDFYYHNTLDMMPKARAATLKHSEDLSNAEVIRSIGLLEGLLHLVINQRNGFAVSFSKLSSLKSTIEKAQSLWVPESYEIQNMSFESNHSTIVKWLPNILKVALELIRIHGKLGNLVTTEAQEMISSWIDKISVLAKEWNDLPLLPANITSSNRITLALDIDTSLKDLVDDLESISETLPNLNYILKQIRPWTESNRTEIAIEPRAGDVVLLDEKLSRVCDSIFVTLEKYSANLAKVPTSSEDPTWFILSSATLLAAIDSLKVAQIVTQIDQTFDILGLKDLMVNKNARAAGALFAVAYPVFQQYFLIVQNSVARYAELHRSTSKMTYILAKQFLQIATQGFCTPSEKSDTQDGKTDKLEGGTGLGDGEGAEDISKDIQDDEDLSELAQEPNKDEKGEIEDEKDAVDMADGDMEGEIGEAEEKGEDKNASGDEDEGQDEIDDEAGDVDDLDPNAVDEKMWDGDGQQAEKEQESDKAEGKENKREQAAAQESDNKMEMGEKREEEEEVEEMGAEQSEEVRQDEVEKHDPHAQEEEALELPEDMELDGEGSEGSASAGEDEMAGMSDLEDKSGHAEEGDDDKGGAEGVEDQEEEDAGSNVDVADVNKSDEEGDQTEHAAEEQEEKDDNEVNQDEESLLQRPTDDAITDDQKADSDNVQGIGQDQDQDDSLANDVNTSANMAQHQEGGSGGDSSEQKDAAAEDGEMTRQTNGNSGQDPNDNMQDATEAPPFKKLGDALEKWHRQQARQQNVSLENDKSDNQTLDVKEIDTEFQHLQDENAEADAQAMGTATEEQAHPLDESLAIDQETKEMPEIFQPDELAVEEPDEDIQMEEPDEQQVEQPKHEFKDRAGATIERARKHEDRDFDAAQAQKAAELEDDVEDVDTQLSTTRIDDLAFSSSLSDSEARDQWTHYESLTRSLALSLTEQLRLILAPTLATKMRGDFRTGKRLNIKRIIPYIASQYKRDKIWMRRSVPSKRNYQILLAVDDSESMGESGSGALAFETLVMVAKSLSMLEVGEIGVLSFGEDVHMAHDFDLPFSSDAGPKAIQKFGFRQGKTDFRRLVRKSIDLFREARMKALGRPQDLWQLELIISDGICPSTDHEPIRQLLREAIEERIMMVFVLVDDVKTKEGGRSVMDLQGATFVDGKVQIVRYLDTFPFQYYLVVNDVEELPGVLATLLRQWFAEVADSSG